VFTRGIRRIATACESAGNPAPEFRYSVACRAADAMAGGASGERTGTARSNTVEGRVGGQAGGQALFLVFTVLCFNFVDDGLRDGAAPYK